MGSRQWVREYTSGAATGKDFTVSDIPGTPAVLPDWFELPNGGTLVAVDGDGAAVTLSNLTAGARYGVSLRSITTCTDTIRCGTANAAGVPTVGTQGAVGPDFVVTAAKTAGYTAAIGEDVRVDTTGGTVAVTLPTAVGVAGKRIRVKDTAGTAGTNAITMAATSSQTIDGAAATSVKIASNYGALTFISDGANWMTDGAALPAFNVTALKTSGYTAVAGDFVKVNPAGGTVAITLPTAVGVAGQRIIVKDFGAAGAGASATHTITVGTTSSQTIDGASTATITSNAGKVTVVSDGANWMTA